MINKIILASKSEVRKKILKENHIEFERLNGKLSSKKRAQKILNFEKNGNT